MKHLVISILCLLGLILPWGIYNNYSAGVIAGFNAALEEDVLPAIGSGNWQNAEKSFDVIQKDWKKYQKVSAYFIDTASISDVNGLISRTDAYILMRDASDATAECALLKDKLRDLHENELLSHENLF